jgi:alkylhydroperoxidase family enzyme
MSRIRLDSEAPGIVGLLQSFPVIGNVLNQLAQTLLVGSHDNVYIPRWVREYIAASCSQKGKTDFCENSHFAIALAASPFETYDAMHRVVLYDFRIQAIEHLAHAVYGRPSTVTEADFEACAVHGYTNEEIHLIVAIACAFRMFNAYVKTVGNPGLDSEAGYQAMGEEIAVKGYLSI